MQCLCYCFGFSGSSNVIRAFPLFVFLAEIERHSYRICISLVPVWGMVTGFCHTSTQEVYDHGSLFIIGECLCYGNLFLITFQC